MDNENRFGFKAYNTGLVCRGYQYDEKKRYVPICVKSAKVDGEIMKEDTWYLLKDGEFVEVE